MPFTCKRTSAVERQTKQRTNASFIKDSVVHYRGQNRPSIGTKLFFSIIDNTVRPHTNQLANKSIRE